MGASGDEKDKYYQILGLNPGASEEEIKEAYRDLVTVWHPDRFSNNSRLRHKANEKIMDINIAYEKLKSGFARETSTTSDGKSHVRSQPPPHNPPHRSEEKQQTETSDNLHTGSRPPQKEPPGGVRSWLTAAIVGGMAVVILFFFILFLTFYRQPTRATDYTETASAISSSFPLEQPTSTAPASTLPVVRLPQEIEKLKDLLENIQQANLAKDITLFMSCYASDFKDREEKRTATLDTWSKYSYVDLIYGLKVDSMSVNSAKATVEWRFRFTPTTGGQLEWGRSVLNVTFEKEKNEWKIGEVVPTK